MKRTLLFLSLIAPAGLAEAEFLVSDTNFLRCLGLAYLDCAVGVITFLMLLPAGKRLQEGAERRRKLKGLSAG